MRKLSDIEAINFMQIELKFINSIKTNFAKIL